MMKALLRFQEHYESPHFQGKVFTWGQYQDWYAQKFGAFTYFQDWSGFNFPGETLKLFIQGLFDPLLKEEQEILDLFRYRTDKFYIIGTLIGEETTRLHEICHGLYYCSPEYVNEVQEILIKYKDEVQSFKKSLINRGYAENVLDDECNAYFIEGSESCSEELHLALKDLFDKHLAKFDEQA